MTSHVVSLWFHISSKRFFLLHKRNSTRNWFLEHLTIHSILNLVTHLRFHAAHSASYFWNEQASRSVNFMDGKSLACWAVTALHRGAQWSSGCVMDCQVRGPRFKPRPGQKFGSGFLLHAHHLGAVLVDNIWHVRRRAPVSSVRLTSPSFVRRRHLECITWCTPFVATVRLNLTAVITCYHPFKHLCTFTLKLSPTSARTRTHSSTRTHIHNHVHEHTAF